MKTKISARKFLSKYMIYLAFVALLIVFSLTLRNVGNGFLDMGNVWNIIRQTALIAILGVGMTYALGAGQIDLSVGSVVGLTSLVTAWTVQAAGLIPGVLAGLAVGAVVGAINGALIAWVKIPPFIATLGTQILFAGVSRTVSGLKSVPITNTTFNFVFGGGDFGGVPVLLLWMVVIVVVGQLFLAQAPVRTSGHLRGRQPQGRALFRRARQADDLQGHAALRRTCVAGRYSLGRTLRRRPLLAG